MTADELIRVACNKAKLSSMAEDQLPDNASDETKNLIIQSGVSMDELAEIMRNAVNEIDHGSIKTINQLLRVVLKEGLVCTEMA